MASGLAQKAVDYILEHKDSEPKPMYQFSIRRKVNQLLFP